MRFVALKTVDQQGVLMLHRVREQLVRQLTMLTNAFRSHLAELGIIGAQGQSGLKDLVTRFRAQQSELPELARAALRRLIDQIGEVFDEIGKSEKEIVAWCRTDAASRRLLTIPGVGPITASMISASVPDPALFSSGRQFAAWLGLTPKPHSSGGKERLGDISKKCDGTIRLLVVSATALFPTARRDTPSRTLVKQLLERKPARPVSIALANRTAQIA